MSLSLLRPLAAGAVLAVLLAGCGDDTSTTKESADTADAGGAAGTDVRGGTPGAFGEIAAVDGDVLQVQNQMTGQVAVTVTGDTAITAQAAAALTDVTKGVCVVVRSADTDGSVDGTATAVTAASVAVSPAGDDGCTGGFGGPGGAGAGSGERPTDMPTDMPTDRPSGMPNGGRGGFGTAGQVTSVSDTGFVVDGPNGSVTVSVVADTGYTKRVASEASALTVGRCVRVQGDADDTGAVTATSVQVSDKVDDQCGL
jgi:hypothetical protein